MDSNSSKPLIVCATRGGQGSRAVQRTAADRARAAGAHLVFLHVVNVGVFRAVDTSVLPAVEAEMHWLGETLLRLAQDRAQSMGVSAEIEILSGKPLAEIANYVQNHNAALLLMGAPRHATADLFGDDEIERIALRLEQETGVRTEVIHPEPERANDVANRIA